MDCENKKPEFYPVGCIHACEIDEDTLAVACNYLDGHSNYGGVWWCKSDKDSVKNMEMYPGLNRLGVEDKADKTLKSFKHMVTWLQEQGIKVTVWNGYKVVKLKEFLR